VAYEQVWEGGHHLVPSWNLDGEFIVSKLTVLGLCLHTPWDISSRALKHCINTINAVVISIADRGSLMIESTPVCAGSFEHCRQDLEGLDAPP
jgi:hypothetical protein